MSLRRTRADENQLEWLRFGVEANDLLQPVPEEVVKYREFIFDDVGWDTERSIKSIVPIGDVEENLFSIRYNLSNGQALSVAMHFFSESVKVFEIALITESSDKDDIRVLCTLDPEEPSKAARMVDYYIRSIPYHNPRPKIWEEMVIIPFKE